MSSNNFFEHYRILPSGHVLPLNGNTFCERTENDLIEIQPLLLKTPVCYNWVFFQNNYEGRDEYDNYMQPNFTARQVHVYL